MRSLSSILSILFLAAALASSQPVLAKDTEEWSQSTPSLNLTHIFHGNINKHGKATGFHHRPGGKDLPKKRVKELLSGPNKAGVYTAIIELFNPETDKWVQKFSSMFPDHLKRNELVPAILNAYRNRHQKKGRKWSSLSPLGFVIAGFTLKDGRIITAYPIYQPD